MLLGLVGVDLFLVLLDQLVVLVLPLGGLGLLVDLQVRVIHRIWHNQSHKVRYTKYLKRKGKFTYRSLWVNVQVGVHDVQDTLGKVDRLAEGVAGAKGRGVEEQLGDLAGGLVVLVGLDFFEKCLKWILEF